MRTSVARINNPNTGTNSRVKKALRVPAAPRAIGRRPPNFVCRGWWLGRVVRRDVVDSLPSAEVSVDVSAKVSAGGSADMPVTVVNVSIDGSAAAPDAPLLTAVVAGASATDG